MLEATVPDLSRPRRVHIIGIGGAGMGAIAEVLHRMGHHVSGTDLAASRTVDRLVALGIDAAVGHAADAVHGAEIVARSTAIPDTNVEVAEVAARGGTVWRRSELLAAITALRQTVAVAGTHGKTTTSAMLSVIALRAGLDPSFIVGGDVTELGSGAAWGAGEWFVVEADESDGTFLELGHTIGVVTNVEPDHLDHYGGEEPLRRAFRRFVDAGERAVLCVDDVGAAELADSPGAVTYGTADGADYRMSAVERSADGIEFDLVAAPGPLGRIRVAMPGMHNARNAAAAAVTAMLMGVGMPDVVDALHEFGGVGRRFQHRGEAAGVTFVDDYAHLPTEVAAALDAARDLGRDRVVAIFQPHRFSRTESLWADFTGAFDAADLVIVTDVYAAGEAPRPGVSGELLVRAIEAGDDPPEHLYVARREHLADEVAGLLRPGDLCLTLGAGDLVTLPDELLARLGAGR